MYGTAERTAGKVLGCFAGREFVVQSHVPSADRPSDTPVEITWTVGWSSFRRHLELLENARHALEPL